MLNRRSTSPELISLLAILAMFLTVNILTAEISPTVWIDEVMFTDPAVNLENSLDILHRPAWSAQSDQDFWSGYPPLYSVLLSAWLRVAPISPAGVRWLDADADGAFVPCILARAQAQSDHQMRSARLLFIILILCGYSTTFSYRCGRADTLGILIVSLLALLVAWALLAFVWRLFSPSELYCPGPVCSLFFILAYWGC